MTPEQKKLMNIFILGFAFMFMFTAFQTCGNVAQTVISSLNNTEFRGSGYTSMAIIYGVFSASNLIAPSVVALIGCQLSMFASGLFYSAYIAMFIQPYTWSFYTLSVLIGIAAAVLWTAQGTCLTVNSDDKTIGRNSGIFWALLQFSMLFGNLYIYVAWKGEATISDRDRRTLFIALTVISLVGTFLFFLIRTPASNTIQQSEEDDGSSDILESNLMTIPTFDYLLEKLHPRLYRTNTDMRRSVPPEERLLITIRFLASGLSYTSLNHFFLLGISTISGIVHETCEAIWEELRSSAMPVPDATMWHEIANGFWKKTQFPNCVGALDGKHIRIQKPPGSGSQFYNYKKYFSLVLMAICDSNYRFVAVDIGAYGSNADARVFSASQMGRRLLEGNFNFPSDKPLPSTVGPDLPHVLVADEAFGLSKHLLRPYARHNLTTPKKFFNYRLSRARRLIECTFGILSGKWRIFHTTIQLSVENAQLAIQACCILHNVIREKEGISVEEEDEIDLPSVRFSGLRPNNSAITMRDNFTNFFMSPEGEVPWQYEYA